jgi:3-oxoadipate enol-lactonase
MTRPVDHLDSPTAWREAGDPELPPIVFLHGLGGTRKAWGPQLQGLSGEFRCIAWDMPGYGASAPEPELTYAAIADRLVALLDALELPVVDLIGLSFGGMHALHTALRQPDRIGRMVLLDTSPAFGMNGTGKQDWIDARLGPIDAGQTPADIAPFVLDAIVGRPLEPSIRAELIEAFGDIPVDGFRAAVHCLPHNDLRADLHRIVQQTLVVVGEIDEETPVEYAAVLADGLPNAELHVLSGIGHLSPSEDPVAVNDLIRTFLSRSNEDTP